MAKKKDYTFRDVLKDNGFPVSKKGASGTKKSKPAKPAKSPLKKSKPVERPVYRYTSNDEGERFYSKLWPRSNKTLIVGFITFDGGIQYSGGKGVRIEFQDPSPFNVKYVSGGGKVIRADEFKKAYTKVLKIIQAGVKGKKPAAAKPKKGSTNGL